jgi:DNA-binding Lrp family transcriptional regulator
MAAKAYILLRTAPGLTNVVQDALTASPGVQAVEMITGPYDLIVTIEAASTNAILDVVMRDIRPAAGIWETLTCLVVPGEEVD